MIAGSNFFYPTMRAPNIKKRPSIYCRIRGVSLAFTVAASLAQLSKQHGYIVVTDESKSSLHRLKRAFRGRGLACQIMRDPKCEWSSVVGLEAGHLPPGSEGIYHSVTEFLITLRMLEDPNIKSPPTAIQRLLGVAESQDPEIRSRQWHALKKLQRDASVSSIRLLRRTLSSLTHWNPQQSMLLPTLVRCLQVRENQLRVNAMEGNQNPLNASDVEVLRHVVARAHELELHKALNNSNQPLVSKEIQSLLSCLVFANGVLDSALGEKNKTLSSVKSEIEDVLANKRLLQKAPVSGLPLELIMHSYATTESTMEAARNGLRQDLATSGSPFFQGLYKSDTKPAPVTEAPSPALVPKQAPLETHTQETPEKSPAPTKDQSTPEDLDGFDDDDDDADNSEPLGFNFDASSEASEVEAGPRMPPRPPLLRPGPPPFAAQQAPIDFGAKLQQLKAAKAPQANASKGGKGNKKNKKKKAARKAAANRKQQEMEEKLAELQNKLNEAKREKEREALEKKRKEEEAAQKKLKRQAGARASAMKSAAGTSVVSAANTGASSVAGTAAGTNMASSAGSSMQSGMMSSIAF
eukprot:Blabericola_migrator_1__2188@NODE_1602_length_4191_cov_141_852813_g377_i1_p2_GENE_NODE_1602_length_4191_cov_141_852813_g377_i1NODE_1602_length_4191_cov_141_852813_g377_i1_p2_ORF_typecomplete_len580_score125_61SMC_N/PF02463_19/6_2e05DUF3498/PF12004_8/2e03DUF3498/PF12004_8/0_0041HEAT_2/PF13646_6/0_12HEAT_2/PF13646_6/3_4e02DUF4407/PF14362_6/0_023AAA_23/PF13476_6/0_024Coilin_N/PF15862_5/0_047PDCD7/PF16021_5/1_4e02PDCD7/PF16021_5/0_73OmpH/PF03938_14/2_4e03OmpH/PF03938_14/0_79Cwf_Cwc_15/PF04889_12/1e0